MQRRRSVLLNTIFSLISCTLFAASFVRESTCWAVHQQSVPCAKLTTVTEKITLSTLYGTFEIVEPIIIELIESAPFQRLKQIYQLGIWRYAVKDDAFTRYDHSIGVFTLVRKHGGSLKEQIAALLHDVSHTVFSHVGAYFFVDNAETMDAFQDNLHEWYLQTTGLGDILERHGYTISDVIPKHAAFKRLEQELPNLCADRIDYNIRGALWDGLITATEAQSIIESLEFGNGTWYLTNLPAARMLAEASCAMTRTIWGSAENFLTGEWLACALKQAASRGIITSDDIYFSTDTAVWNILKTSAEPIISENIYKIEHCYDFFVHDAINFTAEYFGKHRGVDPLVQTEEGLQHITAIDPAAAEIYAETRATMRNGWKVRVL